MREITCEYSSIDAIKFLMQELSQQKGNRLIELIPASDTANLLYELYRDKTLFASVYKSFDKNLNEILLLKYII